MGARDRAVHILIVDDNETNLRVASLICDTLGFTHEQALSGKRAIKAAAMNRFDLVLMDICMPGMDGVEATLGIHALDADSARLPIIAVTTNADLCDRARYAAAGMFAVVRKPIHLADLCEAMERALVRV